jgi:tetratricopeptide (TPR) repeat protein
MVYQKYSSNVTLDPYNDNVTPKFDKSPHREIDDTQKFLRSPKNKSNELALTQLNMCAILSQRGDHQAALQHAESSIEKLEQQLNYALRKIRDMSPMQVERSQEYIKEAVEKQSLLAIAYYNQGSQQEFLKMFSKSMVSYKTAMELEKSKH